MKMCLSNFGMGPFVNVPGSFALFPSRSASPTLFPDTFIVHACTTRRGVEQTSARLLDGQVCVVLLFVSSERHTDSEPVLLKFAPSVNSCNIRFWGNRDRPWSRFPQGAPNESKRRPDHRDCSSISRNLCTAAWAGADARTFYL